MRRFSLSSIAAPVLTALAVSAVALPAAAGAISADLERAMAARGSHAETAVIVRLVDPVDPAPLRVTDRRARSNRLLVALREAAGRHRETLSPVLQALGAKAVRELWIINGLSARLPASAVRTLAAHEAVARIDLDYFIEGANPRMRSQPIGAMRGATPASAPLADDADPPGRGAALARAKPLWNIAAVHAPEVWSLGHTGQGVVIATMDTGADLSHPDLRRAWRGGTNSWFDPHGESVSPSDAVGHGTQALGVMLAGGARGLAPDARWIAARLYNGANRTRMSDIHRAFQWLMDPDEDPATIDAPDVVNASWALIGRTPGSCLREFEEDVRALRDAGIAVVFAAGNDGPFEGTSNSPGNNPGVLSVGAVGRDLLVARQSSRGPSSCGGGVYPSVVAPGVAIGTTDLSYGGIPSYTMASGTSMAAPHVAGVLALLAGAFPAASVSELEAALLRGAQDVGPPGPDNSHGHGMVDAVAAFKLLQSQGLEAVRGGPQDNGLLASGAPPVGARPVGARPVGPRPVGAPQRAPSLPVAAGTH
jgi:serine protease AprX